MENIKSNLKGLVGSIVSGIPINELESEYYDMTNSHLNYKDFGFKNLRNFLECISDVVEINDRNGQSIVKMAISEDDPRSLQDLYDLVKCTKTKKKTIRNEVSQKNSNYVSSRTPLEDFTISVSNNHYKRDSRSKSPQRFTKKVDLRQLTKMIPLRSQYQSAYKSPIKSSRHHSPPRIQRRNTVIDEFRDHPSSHDTRHRNEPITNGVHKDDRISETKDIKPTVEPALDYGCWFVKPELKFDAFHTEVKIIGIQSGYAVIIEAGSKRSKAFLELKNITTVYPGDLVFWQPPFLDPERAPTTVDVNTGFPAIVIRRIDMKKVQVRIMGLVMLLEVSIADLHEMPSTTTLLSKTISRIESRKATIVRLAFVPPSAQIWEANVYPDTYTVMFSLDGGAKVLEHTAKPGHFLNLSLLNHIHDQLLLSSNNDDKRSFYQHITGCIDRSMVALRPHFEKLISDQDHCHPDNDALRLVYNLDECVDQILLGCKKMLASPRSCGESSPGPAKEIVLLHRMRYQDHTAAFHSFDDKSDDVVLDGPWPVSGLYIVNRAFTESWLGHRDDPLRFRTAVMTDMPTLVDLALSLGLHDL